MSVNTLCGLLLFSGVVVLLLILGPRTEVPEIEYPRDAGLWVAN